MSHYDAIVIGAGMSGMAAAIRLGMSDKRVALFESHRIPGGLNSYYQRGKRLLDVGLHALTNFVPQGTRSAPLIKLLRQLRIPYEEWQLAPQSFSAITFPDARLEFDNHLERLRQTVREQFPQDADNFDRLVAHVRSCDDVSLTGDFISARQVLSHFLQSPSLIDMLLCPLQFYGSSWPHDMDFRQMATMFKALYLEGFARPMGGVRTIISSLEKRIKELPIDVFYNAPVEQILHHQGVACGVRVKGQEYRAPIVFSSAGLRETGTLCTSDSLVQDQGHGEKTFTAPQGPLAFVECLMHFPRTSTTPAKLETINFVSRTPRFYYEAAGDLIDTRSAVVCLPNNYQACELNETQVRVTFLANHALWRDLRTDRARYRDQKEMVLQQALQLAQELHPSLMPASTADLSFNDVFTPTTVEFYTRHHGGAIYGSPTKWRQGTTPINGLYLIGTDQGFLGIVGALLSGITMANIHALQPSPRVALEQEQRPL